MATSTIKKDVRLYVGGVTAGSNITVNAKYVTSIDGVRKDYFLVFTTTATINNGDVLFTNLNEIDVDYTVYCMSNTSLPFERTANGRIKAKNTINSGVTVTLHLPY